jgi:hypothetical protein
MVTFLVVEPTHPDSNPRFDVGITYLRLIILSVVGDVPVYTRRSLTDFMNLKIKSTQSFGGAHRVRVCMRVFIGVSARACMSICICTV